jgi:hypothetical protein
LGWVEHLGRLNSGEFSYTGRSGRVYGKEDEDEDEEEDEECRRVRQNAGLGWIERWGRLNSGEFSYTEEKRMRLREGRGM